MPCVISNGVTVSLKTRLPAACRLPLKASQASKAPSAAPSSDSSSASASMEKRMAPAPKPNTRSVAISVERVLTAEYSVLSAPNRAPKPMTPPTR